MSDARNVIPISDINPLLHEVFEFCVYGLAEEGTDWKGTALVKQWYLERIYLSLGMSLAQIRERLGCLVGENPEGET